METQESLSPNELTLTDYASLISIRIKKILMICSNYDAFILEEDGQIETQIYQEYLDLNLSSPPRFIWATTSDEAEEIINANDDIDMVICMYNTGDKYVFDFARRLKQKSSNIPFVLLTPLSREISRRLSMYDTSCVDFTFCWHGSADLIVAIVKLFEDMANADNDILKIGVRAILLVEDSVRYYSTYLPELYKLVLSQSSEFLKDTYNDRQRKLRKRSRPKILLATNYEDAYEMYEKYKTNLLGVISDVGFVLHRNDPPESEKLDAGIDLVKTIKADDPFMPILLQSSQESISIVAQELGVGFLRKYSKTLILQLSQYIRDEFGFGDFVFRDKRHEEYGRAADLRSLEQAIRDVPDHVLYYNTSRNMLSKWLSARGLFNLANRFRAFPDTDFKDVDSLRKFIIGQISHYRHITGRGIIARFEKETYDRNIWFARVGEGSLGGKARGLAFINSLILNHNLASKYPNIKISIPRTVVVATDYFEQFILENGLQYVIDLEISDEEILSEFVASRLPNDLLEDLRVYISTVRTPLAVRSSSKLEDSIYQPFAGVYSTYMVPLTENRDQMLRMVEKAIKSVYASVFFKGSRRYLQTTGNLLSEELMGVVIQSVCGSVHGDYYYPMLSGVVRSLNYYPLGAEKPEDGIALFAFGLGKTVVDGGCALRFSPNHTNKILQLSDPKLALRDTQKYMYALDMNPGAFIISKNDGVNLVYKPVSEMLADYDHPELVASTYVAADDRIVPGVSQNGTRIISFDALLKYKKYPLSQVFRDIMDICRKELMCDVEIEFAADTIKETNGDDCVLKLLQVRPISSFFQEADVTYEQVCESIKTPLVTCDKALGSGQISGIKYVVYVPSESFDSAKTPEIAQQISQFNTQMKDAGETYMLVGPGRWGSSDSWLGIPVSWNDISEARMIVECAIPGFRVEASQGTHFFQNITSLGVGYLTIDTVSEPDSLNKEAFDSLTIVEKTEYVSLLKAPTELVAYIDRNTSCAKVGLNE